MKSMRHSVGNLVVNGLASALGLSWRVEGKCRGYICEIDNDKDHFVLLKPRLLMNINGRSVIKTGNLVINIQSDAYNWCSIAWYSNILMNGPNIKQIVKYSD